MGTQATGRPRHTFGHCHVPTVPGAFLVRWAGCSQEERSGCAGWFLLNAKVMRGSWGGGTRRTGAASWSGKAQRPRTWGPRGRWGRAGNRLLVFWGQKGFHLVFLLEAASFRPNLPSASLSSHHSLWFLLGCYHLSTRQGHPWPKCQLNFSPSTCPGGIGRARLRGRLTSSSSAGPSHLSFRPGLYHPHPSSCPSPLAMTGQVGGTDFGGAPRTGCPSAS